MSLPREWNLQNSRGSLYCPSEPDPTGRVQYKSGRFIRSSIGGDSGTGTIASCSNGDLPTPQLFNATAAPLGPCEFIACSQPAPASLLTECQQSCGSLFSVVSAPPLPLVELDVKHADALNGLGAIGGGYGHRDGININIGGLQQGAFGLPFNGGAHNATSTADSNAFCSSRLSTTSMDSAAAGVAAIVGGEAGTQRRPASLSIGAPYLPAPSSRTLHSSLLQHQISEIEEDDNENMLTVSSITARPLIAKSRELRCSQLLQQEKGDRAAAKRSRHHASNVAAGMAGRGNARENASRAAASSSLSSMNADPPDGGYGWFIVFGAFSVQFWVAGLVKSYGVLNVEIMETFPKSTATVVSWIPAILSALCLALAPLSSALCQRFSCRSVVFVGGLFCALGMTLSYFATSLLHLLLTFGILTGIGGGLSTTPGIVIVSQYFDKRRALANGICVSGTAAGSFILPVLIKHLAEEYGFHGTILILGGCMLHVCMSATLYKPLEEYSSGVNRALIDAADEEEEVESTRPLNDINPSSGTGILTNSTYLETCEDGLNTQYIEHLFLEESKNRLNDYYNGKQSANNDRSHVSAQESDDEVKDIIGETTFIKPMKKVRSSGIMHSVEDLSTDSTWVYRTDSNRGSRRRRNVFANDEIISKIQAHLDKPLVPPAVTTRGLSKSMEIPTPVSNLAELRRNEEQTAVQLQVRGEADADDDRLAARTCIQRIEMYLDISLLKDPIFILMCLSVTLMSVGCPYMLYFLPAHVLSKGYNKSMAGYMVAVSAVLDLFGRLGLGWLSDLQLFDRKKTYFVCILGAGMAVLALPSADNIFLIGLASAVYGFCLGSWYVLMPVLLADIFGTDRISSSYGLVRMFQSIGAISVPPLAGVLIDFSGGYEITFYCMGLCMVLGCVPLLVGALLEHRDRELFNERDDSDENSTVS